MNKSLWAKQCPQWRSIPSLGANISQSLCNSTHSHRFNLQITWYEFKQGTTTCTSGATPTASRWR
jgi:hypothetical protein